MNVEHRRAVDARQAWTRIVHLFIAENHRRQEIADELDLTLPDLITLFRMQPGDQPSQRDLAQQWACDASWVTTKVDQLESLGLVRRQPHPADRRVKTVVLTPKGERTRQRALDRFYGPPSTFAALTDDEIATLATLLDKLDVPDPMEADRSPLSGWLERKLDKAEASAQSKVAKARNKLGVTPKRLTAKAQQQLDKAQEKVDRAHEKVGKAHDKVGKAHDKVGKAQAKVGKAQSAVGHPPTPG